MTSVVSDNSASPTTPPEDGVVQASVGKEVVQKKPKATAKKSSDALTETSSKKPKRKRHQDGMKCRGQQCRLYPTSDQAAILRRWIGSTRFVWNWALGRQTDHYAAAKKHLAQKTLSAELTQRLNETTPGASHAFLKDMPRTALTQTLRNLEAGWQAFFDGQSGKRLDKPGQPRFRARGGARERINFQVDERHASPVRPLNAAESTTVLKAPAAEKPLQNRGDGDSTLSPENVETVRLIDQPPAAPLCGAGPGEIRLPGLGWVLAHFSEPVMGEVSKITVREQGGQWFASLALINVHPQAWKPTQEQQRRVDFDFPHDDPTCRRRNPHRRGLAALDASGRVGAVGSSDGENVYSLFEQALLDKAAKREDQRKSFQKRQARKRDLALERAGIQRTPEGKWPKGCNAGGKKAPKSKREEKLNARIQGLNLKDLFAKRDAIHRFTTWLVRQHHAIVVETLVLAEMMTSDKGRRFRKQMHEACMGEIVRQLEYKAEKYGRTLIFVDRWFPSSKRCSNPACHEKHADLQLGDRAWTCKHCGTEHERDANAAFNLWQEGWRLLEQVFQQNDTTCLAAGSVVRGSQGQVMALGPAKQAKPKPLGKQARARRAPAASPAVQRFLPSRSLQALPGR